MVVEGRKWNNRLLESQGNPLRLPGGSLPHVGETRGQGKLYEPAGRDGEGLLLRALLLRKSVLRGTGRRRRGSQLPGPQGTSSSEGPWLWVGPREGLPGPIHTPFPVP